MRILKIIGVFIGLLLLVFIVYSWNSKRQIPNKISTTAEADILAQKMLKSLNYEAWDSVKFLSWQSPGGKDYLWDKKRNLAIIKWNNTEVVLNLNTLNGVAKFKGLYLEDKKKEKAIKKAWAYWCNDSFWVFAPFKIFDVGTERSIVEEPDASYGLMVEYLSGGVTPGDKYLWLLDETFKPIGYKLWVKIIPIGGMYFSWDEWITLKDGAKLATLHKSSIKDFGINKIREGKSYIDFGFSNDPFLELLEN